ncbi:hypothetical protein ABK040_006631 [Willaertia magna]
MQQHPTTGFQSYAGIQQPNHSIPTTNSSLISQPQSMVIPSYFPPHIPLNPPSNGSQIQELIRLGQLVMMGYLPNPLSTQPSPTPLNNPPLNASLANNSQPTNPPTPTDFNPEITSEQQQSIYLLQQEMDQLYAQFEKIQKLVQKQNQNQKEMKEMRIFVETLVKEKFEQERKKEIEENEKLSLRQMYSNPSIEVSEAAVKIQRWFRSHFKSIFFFLTLTGAVIAFVVMGMDKSKTVSTHALDPRIENTLMTSSEHVVIGHIYKILKLTHLENVKFFQWKTLMDMRNWYLVSLAVHVFVVITWIVSSEVERANNKKKFSFISFLVNTTTITLSMTLLFTLSLVYLPFLSIHLNK